MPKLHNIDNIPDDYIDDPRFETELQTKLLGALGGSEKIYINIDSIKVGAKSSKYHSHSMQEEFFLILKGMGVLRLDGRLLPVKQGDFFSKPAGKEMAHQFINDGDQVLEILDCGIVDENDIVSYPDEEVVLIKKTGMAFRISDKIEDWSSEANKRSA